MSIDPQLAADRLEADLRAAGTAERAANQKRYLKSDLEHVGARVPQIRTSVRTFTRANRELTHDELVALVLALWSRPVFECRLTACLLLVSYPRRLGPHDLGLLQELIRDSHTWALVDVLAGNVLGTLITTHPTAASRLDAWAKDPDFWVRRAALLSQLTPLRRGAADFGRFARYADALLDEREFFIRKAIGWVLRDVGRRDPHTVYEWLAPRVDRASGVTIREAVKYLPAEQRDEILGDYRKRRGRPAGRPRSRHTSGRGG